MNLIDSLIGPECGVELYEETNAQIWVDCQQQMDMFNQICSTLPIVIIVVLLFVYFGDQLAGKIAKQVLLGAIVFLILRNVFWIPWAAKTQFDRGQKELDARLSAGMSREDAIKQLQTQYLQKEMINSNSGSGLLSFFSPHRTMLMQ